MRCKCLPVFVFISKPQGKWAKLHNYKHKLSLLLFLPHLFVPVFHSTIYTFTPVLQPHISRLRKQHSMFLSFPWPLVPEPSEKGSIHNANVCCSLITAPLVGDEAEKQTFCLLSSVLLSPLFLPLIFVILLVSPATRLTPSVCICVCVCV